MKSINAILIIVLVLYSSDCLQLRSKTSSIWRTCSDYRLNDLNRQLLVKCRRISGSWAWSNVDLQQALKLQFNGKPCIVNYIYNFFKSNVSCYKAAHHGYYQYDGELDLNDLFENQNGVLKQIRNLELSDIKK